MNFKKYVKYIPFLIFLIILTKNGFLSYRYATWSSRSLIEFNVGVLVSVPTEIWRILDSVIFAAIAVLLSKLLANNNESPFFYNCLACLFVGLFILTFSKILESAGWLATTTNYIWPICFILIHFYLLKEFIFKNKDISKFKRSIIYLILIITLLEAISSEQLLVMVGGAYLFTIVYCLYKKIEIPKLIYLFIIIILFNFIYDFCCPGNINRYNKTIRTVFPEYATFNLINKLDIGTTLFLNWTTTRCDIITIIFFGIMGIYGYIISQKRKIALLTFIPIIIVLAFWTMRFIGPASIVHFVALGGSVYGLLSLDSLTIQVCLTLYGLMIMSVLIFLYLVYKYRTKELGYILTCLLIIGFASVIILGFTPSLFSSGRIFFYFTFILIIISTMLIRDIDKYLEYTKK